jgi:hypothetical protein
MNDTDIKSIKREKSDRVRHICKIVLMQIIFPRAYHLLAQDPLLFREVENFAERRQNKLRDDDKAVFDQPRLQQLLNLPPIFTPLSDTDIDRLFTLSKTTASSPEHA